MSSSESEDLLLPTDFCGERSCLKILPVKSLQHSHQTSESSARKKLQTNEIHTDSKIYPPNRNKSVKSSVAGATKIQKRRRKDVVPPALKGEIDGDDHLYQPSGEGDHSPDEESPVKPSVRRVLRRRKRGRRGPVIYSDSDSDKNEKCTSAVQLQSSPSTSHETKANVKTGGSRVVSSDEPTSRSPNRIPPFLAKEFNPSSSKKVTSCKGGTGGDTGSVQPVWAKSSASCATAKLLDLKTLTEDCTVGDMEMATSLKSSPKKAKSSDNSADELDASQMEQSFYDCDKLKISRSRFGAFRKRKNYKFAPLIFADDTQHRGTIFATKWITDQDAKQQTSPEKAIWSGGTSSALQLGKSDTSKANIVDKDLESPVCLSASKKCRNPDHESKGSPSKRELSMGSPKEMSRRVGQSLQHEKQTSARGESRSRMKKSAGIHMGHTQAHGPDPHKLINTRKDYVSTISKHAATADNKLASRSPMDAFDDPKIGGNHAADTNLKLEENSHCSPDKNDDSLLECRSDVSPQKRKIFATMSEIFFGDEDEKIKPAPTKRRILESENVEEIVKGQNQNEVTLLDDDSLWVSSRK